MSLSDLLGPCSKDCISLEGSTKLLPSYTQTYKDLFHSQQVMLDEFGAQIENAESKLDATMRKMVSFFLSIGL